MSEFWEGTHPMSTRREMRVLQHLYNLIFQFSWPKGQALEAFATELSEVGAQENQGSRQGAASALTSESPQDIAKEITTFL